MYDCFGIGQKMTATPCLKSSQVDYEKDSQVAKTIRPDNGPNPASGRNNSARMRLPDSCELRE